MWNPALSWMACWPLIACCAASARPPVWWLASQGSVDVLTTADGRTAQRVLAELDSLRQAVAQAAPWLASASSPLRVLVFSGEEEFAPYRIHAHSRAYFAGGPDWSVIVLAQADGDTAAALRHELIHFLLRSSGLQLPLWLEEGLADALSSLPQEEMDRRIRLLRGGTRLSWQQIFQAKPGAALYQEWDQARLFYAQSWALTEALIQGARGAVARPDLEEWARLSPSGECATQPLLERFLRRPRPVSRNWKFEGRSTAAAQPAPAGLVWTVLGRLSLQLGRLDAAEANLRRAALVSPEALPWLGELEYRQGRLEQARVAWRAAMRRNVAGVPTLLRLAVLEQDLPGGEMVPVLERILALDPTRDEARLALAAQHIRRGRWAEARQCLVEVRSAPPQWAGFYRQALALVSAKTGHGESIGTN